MELHYLSLNMAQRRSRIDIINDILAAIQRKGGKIKPTHLMYKANLSHKLMTSYLEELMEKALVDEIKEKTNKYLIITDDGYKFLQKFKQMREFQESFGF
jgi:predicted transcriptional regulator